jgi:hypothetical protein
MWSVVAVYRLSSLTVLITFLAAPCLGICAGWNASAHARMACCAGKAQNEADTCCASGERRQSSDVIGLTAAALPAPAPVTFTLTAVVPLPSSAAFDVAHIPRSPRTPIGTCAFPSS